MLHCTVVKVCIVEYLSIAWKVNGRAWVQSMVPFEHNFAMDMIYGTYSLACRIGKFIQLPGWYGMT